MPHVLRRSNHSKVNDSNTLKMPGLNKTNHNRRVCKMRHHQDQISSKRNDNSMAKEVRHNKTSNSHDCTMHHLQDRINSKLNGNRMAKEVRHSKINNRDSWEDSKITLDERL
ncbi:hypothetical protein MACH26_18170 [Planctobacterium marinum]|uniref:Uncharacterized protein n=1 Tax=Planctobacterium marinum TaxID=1631968 RepID=A0AA48HK91_9ALTE|nr:hypothetical protein MACH26_18170 [Planctobacterium marinum]